MYTYIHLPFCASQCIYCDFVVIKKGTPELKGAYLKALIQEIKTTLEDVPESITSIQSIYFGGGTPSQYSAEAIFKLIETLKQFSILSPNAEITLEMNPEGSVSSPSEYKQAGVNRVSVGIQSLQANELKRLSRIHSPQKAIEQIYQIIDAGILNISVDLMHGTPEQTPSSWQNTLEQITQLPIQHISAYGLQVEQDTPLEKLVAQGKMVIPDEDNQVAFYEITQQVLNENHFLQYEISNYAKAGYESQHNLNYWLQGDFYGFGLGAHGYINHNRYANTEVLNDYLENPQLKQTQSLVSETEQLQNTLIFGLRLNQGLNITQLTQIYGQLFSQKLLKILTPSINQGLLSLKEDTLKLTARGQLLSNSVLEPLLKIEAPTPVIN